MREIHRAHVRLCEQVLSYNTQLLLYNSYRNVELITFEAFQDCGPCPQRKQVCLIVPIILYTDLFKQQTA